MSVAVLMAGVSLLAMACSRAPSGAAPEPEYDGASGRLRALRFDANQNGTNESTSYMDGAKIIRVELDLDENGQVERWDFYTGDRELEKVGLASRNDGVMDSQMFYTADDVIERIEISTHRDGLFDKTEFYEDGLLARSEEDTDGDGRVDKWETWVARPGAGANEPAYSITSTAFDDSGSGRPERRFVYGTDGTIERVEVDRTGDGTFEPLRNDTAQAR